MGTRTRTLTEVRAELDGLCSVSMPGGSRAVAVWGQKGGASKSTTAAAILHELSDRLVGMLAGVDADPNRGTLTTRLGLGDSHVPGRLYTLAQDPSVVRYLADWSGYLDRVGRIHVLHNDGVQTRQIKTLTEAQYRAVFDLLARYAEIQIIDLGLSALHPSSQAALRKADHLVITVPADSSVLRVTADALAELNDAGFGDLLSRCTVVITHTQARIKPAVYRQLVEFLTGRVGHVQVVPYDKNAGAGVAAIRWNKLAGGTRLAYAQLTHHVLYSLRQTGLNGEVIPPESLNPPVQPAQPPLADASWKPPTDQLTSDHPSAPQEALPDWATRTAAEPVR